MIKKNNEFDSLENFDLLFLKNSDKNNDYYNNDIIRGKIEFAQFLERDDNQDESDNSVAPCILKPIQIGVTLLDRRAKILPNETYLIPQNDSSMQPTKRTFPLTKKYEHFINRNQINNKILMKQRGEPTSVVPQVILFTLLNNGDPGIKELFMVDHNLFKNTKVGVTLLRKDGMLHLESLVSTINHVSITSGM
ncbi:10207_t:CDS:2 [Funneliformis caledonium]|uniref:10207_t:CDS:1 n=1 Tax=Funneliformis caledonium TaxID=1117310 RepID=A0A9N9CIT3_9GLOM|nr:10207_t:CDS:2 [Funneliformis caledonium]